MGFLVEFIKLCFENLKSIGFNKCLKLKDYGVLSGIDNWGEELI